VVPHFWTAAIANGFNSPSGCLDVTIIKRAGQAADDHV
jgi:hypothetical protein